MFIARMNACVKKSMATDDLFYPLTQLNALIDISVMNKILFVLIKNYVTAPCPLQELLTEESKNTNSTFNNSTTTNCLFLFLVIISNFVYIGWESI